MYIIYTMQSQQVANSQFCSTGQGHPFKLRNPLAKVTARKCADCAIDIFQHSRGEVQDVDALKILDIVADTKVYIYMCTCEREIEREMVCVCVCVCIHQIEEPSCKSYGTKVCRLFIIRFRAKNT